MRCILREDFGHNQGMVAAILLNGPADHKRAHELQAAPKVNQDFSLAFASWETDATEENLSSYALQGYANVTRERLRCDGLKASGAAVI